MIGVCIVTYNQEQYIAQAIESVLMQEPCGHEVVIYIGEDNSTDNTPQICDEYVRKINQMSRADALNEPLSLNDDTSVKCKTYGVKIKVIHNAKNLGLVGNTMNLLDIMRKDGCEYIAMLDGDDYWIDSKKLQKQMAYFEAHPEYGLVHTCGDDLWPYGIVKDKRTEVKEGDVSSIISNYTIGNCTVVFKTELLKYIDFEEFQQQGFMSCDYIMYIIFSCYTQFGFIPDHTAVWRRGHDSVSNTNDMEKQIRYVQNDVAMWRYAAKKYPDRWHAEDDEIEKYCHFKAFAIAFNYCDKRRALQEAQLMGEDYTKKNRLKIIVAHSKILMRLWRWGKRRKDVNF